MDKKLSQLQERIRSYKTTHAPTVYEQNNFSVGKTAIELLSAVLSGMLIGMILDKMFDTKLLFKFICVILSCVASIYSMYKQTQKR